ncbi:hypothetical protein LVJ94_44275 [Pendulispora rubella]|uniref:RanBP2-type domain-containing protein n=1 Tax=Pendulispora rubella TaxID=2741070 RepID=A0ABZ2L5L7_9BACT
MDTCWKCDHRNVAGAKFCAACGTSQARRASIKSSMPTEYEQQAIDPSTIGPARPSLSFEVGSHVLVQWSDGNRYPGSIVQVASGQCLVLFSNGQHYWIDVRFVSPAP